MLREFLEGLVQHAGKSSEPKKVPFDLGPRQAAFVVNGAVQVFHTPNPTVNFTAENLEDFVKLCKKFGADLVLIGSTSITGFQDASERLHAVHWERKYTPAFERLLGWKKGKEVDQRGLIALLRNELRDAAGATAMLTAARNMKFQAGETTTGTVQRGDESLGNDVMAKLVNADQLPELLKIDTTVYLDQSLDDSRELTLLVDPVPVNKTIRLQSLEDELEQVQTDVRNEAKQELIQLLPDTTVILGS